MRQLPRLPAVVTSTDLALADVSNDVAERAVRNKSWQRGGRGIYLTHADNPTDDELRQIAQAHVGEDFVVTGLVVMRALRLPWLSPDPRIHVLVPARTRRSSTRFVRVSRTATYDALETW